MLSLEIASKELLRTHSLQLGSPFLRILTLIDQAHFEDVLAEHVAYAVDEARRRTLALQEDTQIGLGVDFDLVETIEIGVDVQKLAALLELDLPDRRRPRRLDVDNRH